MHLATKLEFSGSEKVIHGLSKCHPVNNDRTTVCSLTNNVPYLRELKEDGISVSILGMPGKNFLQVCFAAPFYLIKLYRLLKNERVTILVMHSFLAGIMGRLAGFLARTPLMIRYLNNMELDLPGRIKVERYLRHITSYYLAASHGLREYAQKNASIPDSQISVVYSGIDISAIERIPTRPLEKKKELGLAEDGIYIGIIGRLTEQKGVIYAIEAMPEILSKFPNARLVIIGNGPLMPN